MCVLLQKGEEGRVALFMERFLRHDGVFILRLMTMASNGLTTVDLTGALWKNYWKAHPPTGDVTLTGGTDPSTFMLTGRRQPADAAEDSAVKRKLVHDEQ